MTMALSKKEFLVLRAVAEETYESVRGLASRLDLSLGSVSNAVSSLKEKGLLSSDAKLTKEGAGALVPYRVDSAVIMAAGASTRFVPLSYDIPKALLRVRGEVLIERQIKQLQEVGIHDITVVTGFKKEALFYLEAKMDVKIIVNPEFLEKNNIETLWLARKYISNTYICSCDQYFLHNPFHLFEYSSFIDVEPVKTERNASFAKIGARQRIVSVERKRGMGMALTGHAFWSSEFSKAFLELIEEHRELGDYDRNFWERLWGDYLEELPVVESNPLSEGEVYDFNSLEELRQFDSEYVNNVDSEIFDNICNVFHCEPKDIVGIRTIKKGLTNTSFVFSVFGNEYVYRHPGVGSNSIINRQHEHTMLKLALKYGLDPSFFEMDEQKGWKISKYIRDIREPDYRNKGDRLRVFEMLKKLHSIPERVDWHFRPYEDALALEAKIKEVGPITMSGYSELQERIRILNAELKTDNVPECLCHCDTYAPNWMFAGGDTYLIDWEYGGMSDPAVDVGYFIVDGEFTLEEAKKLIKEYLGEKYTEQLCRHYIGVAALVSNYWFIWALYKESRGAIMGEALYRWYKMAVVLSEIANH